MTTRQIWQLLIPLIVFAVCVAAGLILRHIFFGFLHRWSARVANRLDDIFVSTLRTPILLWSVMVGLELATRTSTMPRKYVGPVHEVLAALWIISLTFIAARIAGGFVRSYSARATGAVVSATLTKNVVQIVVFSLGILILLNQMRVDIRPLLTALGVGGLAVALALQDTLANLFAGFYISVSGQTRIGDYIKLNSGEEGYVSDIAWRSTTLRALSNNYIFIPNSKLAQAIVTNYNLPTKSIGLSIAVRIANDSDTDRVEAILVAEALAGAEQIKGLLADPPPTVTWNPGLGHAGLQLSLNYHVAEFVDQFNVQSELRKRIFKRFRKENIPLPNQLRAAPC